MKWQGRYFNNESEKKVSLLLSSNLMYTLNLCTSNGVTQTIRVFHLYHLIGKLPRMCDNVRCLFKNSYTVRAFVEKVFSLSIVVHVLCSTAHIDFRRTYRFVMLVVYFNFFLLFEWTFHFVDNVCSRSATYHIAYSHFLLLLHFHPYIDPLPLRLRFFFQSFWIRSHSKNQKMPWLVFFFLICFVSAFI